MELHISGSDLYYLDRVNSKWRGAPDYQTAISLLRDSPLAIPVIFTVCGHNAGEKCIIERQENAAHIIEYSEVCTTNHWQKRNWTGYPRPIRSKDRLAAAKLASREFVGEEEVVASTYSQFS
jgi:hypothetical protein